MIPRKSTRMPRIVKDMIVDIEKSQNLVKSTMIFVKQHQKIAPDRAWKMGEGAVRTRHLKTLAFFTSSP
jgi:hypothetical protein